MLFRSYLSKSVKKTTINRAPSSIAPVRKIETKQDQFELDLVEQYKKQQKHKKDLNDLIDALDSYKKDFNTNY